ncbi:Hsp33 family molecular chaperone HslO [Aestuariibacter halophilus]|uniref:33 kDa chaperonin n=1 Tax=Fluctibacter halophilus TaxID=226011 RepID=A0ABS8GCY1_9ALTE|nr:Hsp33 family molecular chaperone HslO [Aestuariibacter halophilus]MCC2617056.1 Hsp33 family molecular chaperone HslO [Aestuariibacter halophilus]
MQSQDTLYRYLFNDANVRGELVQLQDSFQAILDNNNYPAPIAELIGEMLAATCLLTATLKFEGEVALQLQSEGAVKYIVINGTHDQKVRGVARWDEQLETLPSSFDQLFYKGVLVITITPDKGERYQGMVALDKGSLAACLESYFEQSEQLATRVMLATDLSTDKPRAGGILLQVLPTSSEATQRADRPEFDHLMQLTDTLTSKEMLELPAQDVLYRLYHQETVELFSPQPVQFTCSCSRERSAAALASVDKQELLDIIASDGDIKMNCQYCHAEYRFDAIDVETLHAGGELGPDQGSTAH